MPKDRGPKPPSWRWVGSSPLWLRIVAAALLLAVAVYAILPMVIARLAVRALAERGLPEAQIGRVEIGWGRLRFIDVTFDAGGLNRIHEAEVRFSAGGLRAGRVAALRLDGVRLELRPWGPGRALPGWQPAPAASSAPPGAMIGIGDVEVRDVTATIATPAGPVLLISPRVPVTLGRNGAVSIAAAVRVEHAGAAATGQLQAALQANDLDATATFDRLDVSGDRLRVRDFSGKAQVRRHDGGLAATAALRGVLLSGRRAVRLAFDLERQAAGQGSAVLELSAGASRLSGRVQVTTAADGAKLSGTASLAAFDPSLIGGPAGRIDAKLAAQGVAAAEAANLRVALQGSAALAAGRVGRASLSGPLSVSLRHGEIRVDLPDCVRIEASDLAVGALRLARLAAACARSAPADPVLALINRASGRYGVESDGRLDALELAWPGAKPVPARRFVLRGLHWTFARGEAAGSGEAGAELADADASPWFAPIGLNLRLRSDVPDQFVVTAKGSQAVGGLSFEGHAQWGPGAIGGASLRLGPLHIAPGADWRAKAAPGLPWIETVSGGIEAMAEAAWDRGGLRSKGVVQLHRATVVAAGITARGIDATLTATNLRPLTMPAPQQIRIDTLDAGAALSRLAVGFGVEGGRLSVGQAGAEWAGGTLTAQPFAVPLGTGEREAASVLAVSGVQVAEVLALVGIDGLTGSGTISGHVPVRLEGGRVIVKDAALEARNGTIAYAPDHPPKALSGGQAAMALQALRDFHYDRLGLTLDGVSGGDSRAVLTLQGRNPSFYDGKAVRFTLNLTGALDTILRRGVAAYRLPDRVRAQFEAQDRSRP